MEYFIGIFLPPFIDYVNQYVKDSREKAFITVLVCMGVASAVDYKLIATASLYDLKAVLFLVATIIAEAMTVYDIFWKHSKVRLLLPGNGVATPVERG